MGGSSVIKQEAQVMNLGIFRGNNIEIKHIIKKWNKEMSNAEKSIQVHLK